MLDGLDAQRGGDVGLAGAGTADQHDIIGHVHKLAAVGLTDQRPIDLAAGEVEARQIAIGREPRDLELVGYRSHLPFGGLCLQKLGQDRDGRIESWRTCVAITILSGVLFSLLQRSVRKAWQPRLYRFLTEADYKSLVGRPAMTAEIALWDCSALGVVASSSWLWRLSAPNRNRSPRATRKQLKASPQPLCLYNSRAWTMPLAPESSGAIASDAAHEADGKKAALR
jgi:hypothetical protein